MLPSTGATAEAAPVSAAGLPKPLPPGEPSLALPVGPPGGDRQTVHGGLPAHAHALWGTRVF